MVLSGYWGWCRPSDPWEIRVSVVSEGDLRAALRDPERSFGLVPPGAVVFNPSPELEEFRAASVPRVLLSATRIVAESNDEKDRQEPHPFFELAVALDRALYPLDLPPARREAFERWQREYRARDLREMGADYLLVSEDWVAQGGAAAGSALGDREAYALIRRWVWESERAGRKTPMTHYLFAVGHGE
jgi:hypothetical protein